jgi:hypothetical protein
MAMTAFFIANFFLCNYRLVSAAPVCNRTKLEPVCSISVGEIAASYLILNSRSFHKSRCGKS